MKRIVLVEFQQTFLIKSVSMRLNQDWGSQIGVELERASLNVMEVHLAHSLGRSLRSLPRSIALQMLLVPESVCSLIFMYFHWFCCIEFHRFSLKFNDFHKLVLIFKVLYGCSSIFINVHWFVLIVNYFKSLSLISNNWVSLCFVYFHAFT